MLLLSVFKTVGIILSIILNLSLVVYCYHMVMILLFTLYSTVLLVTQHSGQLKLCLNVLYT